MVPFQVILAEPRGFCAGVNRAIEIVERALARFGPPIYVRHEIVHNRHVVDSLRDKGAVFVEELEEVPADAVVIFSAHGVARDVVAEAAARGLHHIDATCPLVTKVHREADAMVSEGRQLILIGHDGHPEVEGTLGQVPSGSIRLVECLDDVGRLEIDPDASVAYVTQTTLSVDDTAGIVAALRRKYPHIEGPGREDICYATTNRQEAVKQLAATCDVILVVGSPNSSNSNRLVEVAIDAGSRSYLVQSVGDLDPAWIEGVDRVGLTAGASAPECLVEELVVRLEQLGAQSLERLRVADERVQFSLPRELTA